MNKEFERSIQDITNLLHRGDVKRIAERAGCSQPTVTYVLKHAKEPEKLTEMQLNAYKAAKENAAANRAAEAAAIAE